MEHRIQNSCFFDLVAIDLDGTLVDTIADLHAAVVRMQQTLSRPPSTLPDVRNWVGNGIERLVHRALTESMDDEAPPALMDEALPAFQQAYDEVNGVYSSLYPGVEEGLDWLASMDVPLVCVTNKARRFSVPLLDALGIGGRFEHHIAGDDVSAKKPDPEALLEAARRCHATPSQCVLIGDSVSDIRAARAARFTSVSVSYGYNHGTSIRELSKQWRTDAVIDSFLELPETLSRLAVSFR